MHLDERAWKIVPPSLEGAGYFEIRMRAEVEIRKLLLEIKALNAKIKRLKGYELDARDGEFEQREAYLTRLAADIGPGEHEDAN